MAPPPTFQLELTSLLHLARSIRRRRVRACPAEVLDFHFEHNIWELHMASLIDLDYPRFEGSSYNLWLEVSIPLARFDDYMLTYILPSCWFLCKHQTLLVDGHLNSLSDTVLQQILYIVTIIYCEYFALRFSAEIQRFLFTMCGGSHNIQYLLHLIFTLLIYFHIAFSSFPCFDCSWGHLASVVPHRHPTAAAASGGGQRRAAI